MIRNVIVVSALLMVVSCQTKEMTKVAEQTHVPTLASLSPQWVSVDTVDMEPSLRNFRAQALTNKDMTSLSWFASAPYAGGYHTGVMSIDETVPTVTHFRWQPHQALRKSKFGDLDLLSTTRMVPDKDIILWEVSIKNNGTSKATHNVKIDHIGFISKFPDQEWQWWYPYPTLNGAMTKRDDVIENMRDHIGTGKTQTQQVVEELINGRPVKTSKLATWPSDKQILEAEEFKTSQSQKTLAITDSQTDAISVYSIIDEPAEIKTSNSGGTSNWSIELSPGEEKVIRFGLSWGDNEQNVKRNLPTDEALFLEMWDNIEPTWNERWAEIFKPNNKILSGAFPTLETEDSLAAKVYYTGPLTMLYLMHNNLPQHKKVFLTGGPRWGASITFFWDITEWSTLWAVVDPEMMKEHLKSWIGIDPSKYYGQDNFNGNGVGNGYSANYWALFQMIRAYVTISGDTDFLKQNVEGKTVLGHLEHYATNWQRISIYDSTKGMDDVYKLADFGSDEWNLLECVPTYKHIVPSFNAGYIWMMRETAAFHRQAGNLQRANELEEEASAMVQRLLKLYAGNGVWNSLYPDGRKIEVRHCLDFMFLGRYLPDDIPSDIKKEMMDFVYRELITDKWMRAQSMSDVAAKDSDRPDHGPLGAFDGWPAGTMDALVQLGYPDKALDFYHVIEAVTNEGIWAQAHELWGENKWEKNADVRIAKRGWHNRESSGGISISQVMLKNFFGFYPSVHGEAIRQNADFKFPGKLHHVKYKGKYYTIDATGEKVEMTEEKINDQQ